MPATSATSAATIAARHGHARCVRTAIRGAQIEKWRRTRRQAGWAIARRALGDHRERLEPVVSGRPNIRFMFWIAWPAAPLTRLSSTASTIARSVPAGRCTAMRRMFDARTERVSGAEPGGITSTNGSPA